MSCDCMTEEKIREIIRDELGKLGLDIMVSESYGELRITSSIYCSDGGEIDKSHDSVYFPKCDCGNCS